MIFIELKRRGYKIFYYVTESGAEVDFVVLDRTGHPFIVQACFDLSNDDTRSREETSLAAAMEELHCGGILITPEIFANGRQWITSVSHEA